jgi:hypothetical protein
MFVFAWPQTFIQRAKVVIFMLVPSDNLSIFDIRKQLLNKKQGVPKCENHITVTPKF